MLTIQSLDALDVVLVKLQAGRVGIVGRHEGPVHTGVAESQGVTELVGSHDLQVRALPGAQRPGLVLVEVSVAADAGSGLEGVCQHPA